jgi:hypothetical protein
MDPQAMQQVQQYWTQYWYYFLAAGFVIGLILGLIPLFLGRRRGQPALGLVALVVTAIVGTPSVILGLLSCIIFTVIIVFRGNRTPMATGE